MEELEDLFALDDVAPPEVDRSGAAEIPNAINNRQGTTFWDLASEAGLETTIIRVPATFPAEPMDHGGMLSGLGVPDMRGRVGTPSFYSSDPMFRIDNNEFSLELVKLPARRGTIKTRLIGPDNKLRPTRPAIRL